MNKDNQIQEMAKDLGIAFQLAGTTRFGAVAEVLVNAGYRKASEVAEEIFAEIEKEIEAALESNYRAKKEHYNHSVVPNYDNFNAMCDGKIYAMRGLLDFIAELKKTYAEVDE
jgi:replicative DNA helicase